MENQLSKTINAAMLLFGYQKQQPQLGAALCPPSTMESTTACLT